jgi:hypothetical protein
LQKTKEGKEMKVVVRLAILVAALLLVANMSYAGCSGQELCYNITYHIQGDGTANCTANACLNADGSGWLCLRDGEDSCDGCVDLALFGGGTGWFNTSGDPQSSGKPRWTTWLSIDSSGSSLIQPMEGGQMLTGVTSDSTGAIKTTVTGIQIPCIH